MKYLMVLFTSILLLSGCQSLTSGQSATSLAQLASTHPEVYLSRDISWHLPSAEIVEGSFMAVQSVQGRYGDKHFDLIFQLEKKADSLVMVGVTAMGQQLLQIEYRGGVLTSQVSPLLGEGIRPAYLVSDFLLAFGAADRLRPLLIDKKLVIEHKAENSRVVLYAGQPVVSMSYRYSKNMKGSWPDRVMYRHDVLGYELDIRTLSREML